MASRHAPRSDTPLATSSWAPPQAPRALSSVQNCSFAPIPRDVVVQGSMPNQACAFCGLGVPASARVNISKETKHQGQLARPDSTVAHRCCSNNASKTRSVARQQLANSTGRVTRQAEQQVALQGPARRRRDALQELSAEAVQFAGNAAAPMPEAMEVDGACRLAWSGCRPKADDTVSLALPVARCSSAVFNRCA